MNELTKTEEKPTESAALAVAPPRDLVVIATTPLEMAGAQTQLIGWFGKKIEACKAELAEAEENLALAKTRKWRIQGWIRRVVLSKQAVAYYEKAKAALEEGYCLVPDFPVEIIAIRTTAGGPRRNASEAWHSTPGVNDQVTNSPAIGEGEYVSPEAATRTFSYEKDSGRQDGKKEKRYVSEAVEFLPPDFPYKLVKPKILDDTNKAMAMKIFDEICVVSKPRRAPDPIVVGRVKRTIGTQQRILSFLVSWWIDAGDL